ncbi:MAG: response regulator [Deltaproteobacteria bacterium]|nr:response regulator [Deltaproteobacteria bacterium]
MSKVLIVESEASLAKTLSDAFQKKGIGSIVTGDGAEALNLARSERPSLIVLCVELPRGSGYSVCNKLKKDPELAGIPLILTSAQATDETFEQHKKLRTRAEAYLKKPYTPDEILRAASEHLKGHAALSGAARSDEDDLEVSVDDDADAGGGSVDVAVDEPAPKAVVAARAAEPVRKAAPVRAEPAADEGEPKVKRPTMSLVSDAEAERLRGENRQLRQKVQALEASLQEKELEFNDRLLQESSRGRDAVELKKKLQAIERDVGKHQQAAEKATTEVEKARQDLTRMKKESEDSERERQVLSDKIGQLVDKVKQLAAERDKLQTEIARLEGERDGLKNDVENVQKVKEKAKKAVDIAVQLIGETGLVQ